jgi:prefoldin subunit 5
VTDFRFQHCESDIWNLRQAIEELRSVVGGFEGSIDRLKEEVGQNCSALRGLTSDLLSIRQSQRECEACLTDVKGRALEEGQGRSECTERCPGANSSGA